MGVAPFLVAFVGPSGSGKTTLIEKLAGRLKEKGLRAAAIKRSHHNVEIDREGKDSWRLRMAGANPVILAADGFIARMETVTGKISLAELAASLAGKADIVLAEGFKDEAEPMFVFSGVEQSRMREGRILGYITSGPAPSRTDEGAPVFGRDDVDGIASRIIGLMKVDF